MAWPVGNGRISALSTRATERGVSGYFFLTSPKKAQNEADHDAISIRTFARRVVPALEDGITQYILASLPSSSDGAPIYEICYTHVVIASACPHFDDRRLS